MDDFCGSPFWDWNRTWYTDDPDFTPCFENTVLVWLPCAYLWIFAGLDVYYSLISRARNSLNVSKMSPLCVAKVTVLVALMAVQLVSLAYSVYWEQHGRAVYPVETYTPILRILTFGLALFLLLFGKVKGIRSSKNKPDTLPFIILVTYLPLLVGQLLLNCWSDNNIEYSDRIDLNEKPCPEEDASFLSRLTFFWFEGLAWKGFRKPLEYSDLWNLNTEDMSKTQVPSFDKHWNAAVSKAKMTPERKASFHKKTGSIEIKQKGEKSSKPQASVFPVLVRVFGPTFFFGSILKLVHDLLVFVAPQILSLLISYVSSKEEEYWKGYLYAAILFITSSTQTLILSQYFQKMFLVGMRIRTALVSAIYRKALLISNAARKESTVGEIVNLMSVDAQRFMDLTAYLNMLRSAPLQIALSLYFLWDTLGPSVLAGLAVMILLIPINAVIASKVKKYQISQMKFKDQRVKMMNEILGGIKVLKLYAWEPSFQEQITAIRDKEIKVLKQAAYMNAGTSFIWTCAPFLVSVVTFGTYVLSDESNVLDANKAFVALTLFNTMRVPLSMLPMMIIAVVQVAIVSFATFTWTGGIMDAKTAFVSLSLFNVLRFPLSMLPIVISTMIQAGVSLKRLNKYINAEEIDPNSVSHDNNEADPIVIENGTFSWEENTTVLRNINLRVKEGSLVAVVGTVGAGKSSLLSAMLGEMEKSTGRVNSKGSIAYVAQQAWIQNCTLRNNILFGRPYDPTKYDKVIDGCALKPDLDILPGRDQTEIGEKGINLSGGQKQRVSLARSCYNNGEVYLLDDPLSAVDAHVGKHIFDKVIGPKGLLKRKTRVLVTHGITYLKQMDNIVVMKDGEISEMGTYKELLDKKGAFADFLLQHIGTDDQEDETLLQELEGVIGSKELLARQKSVLSESGDASGDHAFRRQMSTVSQESAEKGSPLRRMSKSIETSSTAKPIPAKEKLIETEKAETGSVKFAVYVHYLKAVGWAMTFWTLFLNFAFQGFAVGSNIWLSVWSNDNAANNTATHDSDFYLGIYGALGVGQAVTALVGSFTLFYSSLNAASSLHGEILRNVLRSPMSFFDTTPLGRVLNRFSKDVDVCDNTLPTIIRGFLHCFYGVIATLAVISYSTPQFIAVIIPTGILYYLIQRFYVATSRQLKRLESVTRSPIYSHFGETLSGSASIRAYGMQDRFINECEAKVDYNQISYYPSIISNRWLAVRLETVGNFIIFFAALFAVLSRDTLSAGLAGLSVSYALQLTQTLNWLVRMTSDVETNIVAVERLKEYAETPQEAAWEIEERKPPPTWPSKGAIEFSNFQTRYREGLDPVLRDFSCNILPGEKIGIVGRTGAGKSSLTLSLFRIIEGIGGSIVIDEEDISKLGLHDLRGRLTIIPQDPVLFSGTLRVNLDPFGKYSDQTIWRALELAHLKSHVEGLTAGLEHDITEGGENLSVGQRQLVCLARALLRKTKILVLDEATAAVDLETDDLIQRTIRDEFKDCTVITIAHRLNTIMDSTRVLVLDKGICVELDTPEKLLKTPTSIFYSMAKDANLVSHS